MFPKVRVVIAESFVQKYQSQEQLLNLETQSDVFLGHPVAFTLVPVNTGRVFFQIRIMHDHVEFLIFHSTR